MIMRNKPCITFITESLPKEMEPTGNVNINWLIQGFISRGFQVSVISFIGLNPHEGNIKENIKYLNKLGVINIKIINNLTNRLKKKINLPVYNFLYSVFEQKKNQKLLSDEIKKSDNKFFFINPDSLIYISKSFKDKIIGGFAGHDGDPYFKINYIFHKKKKFYTYFIMLFRQFLFKKKIYKSLEKLDFAVGFPRYYVNKLQSNLKTTRIHKLPSLCLPDIKKDRGNKLQKKFDRKKIKVLTLGSPHNGFTKMGILYFYEYIWPYIIKNKLEKKFEFNFIGKLSHNYDLLNKLNHPSINFLGYVKNIQPSIQTSDVVLISNNLAPGAGSKLSTIAAYGGCMLVHKVVVDSHIEFRNGFNCLVAENGKEFVEKMIILKNDKDLNFKLRKNIKKTYQRFFKIDFFLNKLINLYKKYEK